VRIKFHSNKNIEWYCMQLELNWIPLQFNSTIGLRFNYNEDKQDVNWWIRYWKSAHEYGVEHNIGV